jgi:hypothetical protein
MKYQAPFGSVDPAAPFVDRNTPAAVVGSKIPAGFPNWTQNEIIDAIAKSGITPADSLQLAKAIQSQKMNYVAAGGTANAITAVLSPAPTSWIDLIGVPIRLVASTSPSGAATFSPNGLAAKSIVKRGGVAIADKEWLPNDIVELMYDGAVVRMIASQRTGLDAAGFQTYGANVALTIADLGKYTNLNTACAVVTLPKASLCPSGSVIALHNTRAGLGLTVQTAAGDDITIGANGAGGGLTSFAMANQESVLLVAFSSANNWVAVTGSAQIRYTPGFASVLNSTAGYKRYPDANSPTGYITEQWGVVTISTANALLPVTLPVAFAYGVVGIIASIAGPGSYGGATGLSLSQIYVWANNVGPTLTWRAWGY